MANPPLKKAPCDGASGCRKSSVEKMLSSRARMIDDFAVERRAYYADGIAVIRRREYYSRAHHARADYRYYSHYKQPRFRAAKAPRV